MSTRSFIAYKKGDTGYEGVYCHWDGYPSGNGRLLLKHYQDLEKISRLVSLGDISSLGAEIGSEHSFDRRPKNETTFYGRDRGEKNVAPKYAKELDELLTYAETSGCEYFYVYMHGKWCFAERGPQYFGFSDGSFLSKLKPLTEEDAIEEDSGQH